MVFESSIYAGDTFNCAVFSQSTYLSVPSTFLRTTRTLDKRMIKAEKILNLTTLCPKCDHF